MKLLLENWRKFVTESNKKTGILNSNHTGDVYISGLYSSNMETVTAGVEGQEVEIISGWQDQGTEWKLIRVDGIEGWVEATDIDMETPSEENDLDQNIGYSAVVLDEDSKQKLLALPIPEGWEPVAHHMTITMGSLRDPNGKHDFSESYSVGDSVELPVVAVGQDERAMAVKVSTPGAIHKKRAFPHVTVAVNRGTGGKPFHSSKIPEENFKPLSGIILNGVVEEVPQ